MTDGFESILSNLISMQTDGSGEGLKACVDYICQLFQQNGILFRRIPNKGNKADNILAGINVQELKNIRTGLVLSGHIDTVGVNLKEWDTNPFIATNINGLIYGRGTVDMKYFVAIVLSLLSEFKKVGYPIFVLFSGDEETDVEGIYQLTSFLQMRNIQPKCALVGEPTNFDLCIANSGYCGYTTVVNGVSAHSSRPDLGVNAIYAASRLIAEIERLNGVYEKQGTTLNVGYIRGGVQRNSVPSEVAFDWEIRFSKEAHRKEIFSVIQALQDKLMQNYGHLYIHVEVKENLPSFEQRSESCSLMTMQQILDTEVIRLPIATEAGFLQKMGIDTLICGAGDVKLAHTSSEHIKMADLHKYQEILLKFVQGLKSKM